MRVITFSREFPAYHPRKGQPTFFVEKVWESLIDCEELSPSKVVELSQETGIVGYTMNNMRHTRFHPKHHTIRSGHRWKAGDWFSPRVWSEKPYRSKQIQFAPDIQIKKVWRFAITNSTYFLDGLKLTYSELKTIALNDGFSDLDDFELWFNLKGDETFSGQIICWNENINY